MRRALARTDYSDWVPTRGEIRKKASPTARLPKGVRAHRRQRQDERPKENLRLATGDWLGERVTSLKAHLKAAPPAPEQVEAQWPGEGSLRRRAEYLEHGIALPPPLAAELEALAREMSLTIAFAG